MKLIKTLVAATAALSACAASAQVTGGLGSLGSSFLTLSGANVTGGKLYTQSQDPGVAGGAVRPFTATSNTVGTWLATGPSSNSNSSTLTFGAGVTGVSFLWGTPDTWNSLTVTTSAGTSTFTAANLGLTSAAQSSYVYFSVVKPAETIKSLTFNSSQNAFEIANVTAVPEPGTYAMLLSGLAAVGFVSRRRRAAGQASDLVAG